MSVEEILELDRLYDMDGGPLLSYYIRGHIDKARFAAAVYQEEYPATISTEAVQHVWIRWLPRVGYDYRLEAQIVYKAARGATPVTLYGVHR